MLKSLPLLFSLCLALLLPNCTPAPTTDTSFTGLVDIGSDRKLFLQCRGVGTPTVILVSGTGGASDEWTHLFDASKPGTNAVASDSSVFKQVSRFTRVCAYDRPGTTHFDGTLGASTAVPQPTTAQNGAADLNAALTAAHVPGPYLLVGASWGGMIAMQFAANHPNEISGLVFVDSASEFLETALTPNQWTDWMNKINQTLGTNNEVPDYVSSVRQIRNTPPLPILPVVVLTSDMPWDLQVGDTGSTWSAWLQAQNLLAARLKATHITNTHSGHGIAIEQPRLVTDAIHTLIESSRAAQPTP